MGLLSVITASHPLAKVALASSLYVTPPCAFC
jgi:hypothetical protein